ncbi:MAG: trypsin-like peptidase domain-containing protein [Desertifilum sp.]|nr:trypsin-like peptidase domain-containing protein [Desertifilum sp.]
MPEFGEIVEFDYKNIDIKKQVEIINFRQSNFYKSRSLALEENDYQSIHFLEKGLRASKAVCLIMRKYKIGKILDICNNKSPDDLPEILLIISKACELKEDFWNEFNPIKTAFDSTHYEDIGKIKKNIDSEVFIPYATGFLVGKNYLLTNHHVLPNPEISEEFVARFCYERNVLGKDKKFIDYTFDSQLFITNQELDYTLIKLNKITDHSTLKNAKLSCEEAGDNFGWLQMLKEDKLISPPISKDSVAEFCPNLDIKDSKLKAKISKFGLLGEPVNIIQHPRGRRKEIVITSNRVQKIYDHRIQYEADADFGSSGSAIFNTDWQLIGIHHAILIKIENEQKSEETEIELVGSLGIRIHCIVQDIYEQSKQDRPDRQEILKFIDRYIERNRKRRIFISAGRKRFEDSKEFHTLFEFNNMQKLGQKVGALLEKESFEVNLVLDQYSNPEGQKLLIKDITDWINETSDRDYESGDLAIELLMNFGSENNSEARGVTAYYVTSRPERRVDAEILLEEIANEVPDLPIRGASPDIFTSTRRLGFCQNLYMPALVLYVGYVDNCQDRQILINSETADKLALGIAEGIKAWSNSLSPFPETLRRV